MDGSGQSVGTNSTDILTCEMHKEFIIDDKAPYEILSFLTPLDNRIWTERSDEWNLAFRVYAGLYAAVYLLIGASAVVMIYKKDCARLKAKTFLAVYTAIAILGFTRCLHLSLDPDGLIGFIHDRFGGWLIISRILSAFGFPSLVASYTLMFLTLVKIANASLKKQWYQYWKYVGPITATPYVIALLAEIVGNTTPYPALITVVVCEAFFTFWGVMVCIVYLFAGVRLLHKIQKQERRTVRVASIQEGDAPRQAQRRESAPVLRRQATTREFENQEYARRHSNIHKTTRKISIITYATAILAIAYSVFSAAKLISISIFIFRNCLGYNERGNSTVWLATMVSTRTAEIPLALVMLYSITDITSAIAVMKGVLCCHRCRKGKTTDDGCRSAATSSTDLTNKLSSAPSTIEHRRVTQTGSTAALLVDRSDTPTDIRQEYVCELEQGEPPATIEVQTDVRLEVNDTPNEHTTAPTRASSAPQTVYFLDAQGDSELSIASVEETSNVLLSTVTVDQSTQTTTHADRSVQTEGLEDGGGPPVVSSSGPGMAKPVPKPRRKRKPNHIIATSGSTLQRFVRKFTV